MKLGDGVEAAIHCAALLARLEDDAIIPGFALAEEFGLSPSYLLKHLKALTASGILQSVPGPSGGYRLAKRAELISRRCHFNLLSGAKNAVALVDGFQTTAPDTAFHSAIA